MSARRRLDGGEISFAVAYVMHWQAAVLDLETSRAPIEEELAGRGAGAGIRERTAGGEGAGEGLATPPACRTRAIASRLSSCLAFGHSSHRMPFAGSLRVVRGQRGHQLGPLTCPRALGGRAVCGG